MYLMSDAGQTCTRVVGVVENISTFRLTERRGRFYLLPTHPAIANRPPTGFAIRTAADAAAVLPDVRAALQALTPDMPVVPVTTAEANAAGELRPWRLGTGIFLAFGAVAVLIAAVGLYSALAYLVSQRTHEIGIRMALGAPRRRIVARIAVYGAAMVAAGTVIGLLAAAVAARWLTDVLYQTSPRDPWVFLTTAAALALAGGAAAIVPARRSTGVDPLIVLKAE
jgi:ABC-type antimicrobial peptide transport system permease subunit